MTKPEPAVEERSEDREQIERWARVLDELSYYAMLGVDVTATAEEIAGAFHRFCETFHPDRHFTRPDDEVRIIARIFARGSEAHRVLSSPRDRELYDLSLSRGEVRPRRFSSMRPGAMAPAEGGSRGPQLEDHVSVAARPFAQKARELAEKGDLGSAKLHAELALVHDPESPPLRELHAWLAAQLLEGRAPGH